MELSSIIQSLVRAFALVGGLGLFAQTPKAMVWVSQVGTAEGVIYNYKIKNCSLSPIWKIDIGRKSNQDPTLDVEPIHVLSPKYWQGVSRWLEESFPERYLLTWKQPDMSMGTALIQPDSIKQDFSVEVLHKSDTYTECMYTVYFASGENYSDKVIILNSVETKQIIKKKH